ncbi:MAG TPA: PAS domain-containing protein [Gemmatimonadales bacterium]|nr:PAS domain-containing protein [Gemmatimonadales bacterium]
MGSLNRTRHRQQHELTELRKQVSDLQAAAVERRRVEDALRHTAEQRRRLLDHAPVGLCWLNEQGQVLLANDALVSRLGYHSTGELIEFCRTFGLFRSNPDAPDPAESRFIPPAGRGRGGLRRNSGEVVPADILAVPATGAGYRGVVVVVF